MDTQNHPTIKQSGDSKNTSDHSTGKRKQSQEELKFEVLSEKKTNQNKEPSSEAEEKEEQASEQDQYLMMICTLCGIVVSTPWNEHIGTSKHQNLLSGKK